MVAPYAVDGDSFAPDKPNVWSTMQVFSPDAASWSLDLSPDGRRFAVLPQPNSTADDKRSMHVTFLLNFFDEVRRRIPADK
jgi:eukaryotic-like serine/threonine-protein kinase